MNKFIKLKDVRLIHIISIVVISSFLYLRFSVLNKTLISSDEGWYLVLLSDMPTSCITRFHLLFKGVDNIYLIRLVNYLLIVCANFIFGYGLFIYAKEQIVKYKYKLLIVLGGIFCGQLYILHCPSFNYICLNLVVTEISFGCLLFGISLEKRIFIILSSFIISFLFPIMITNVIIIPFIILFIYYTQKSFKNVYYFLFGIFLFFIFYFCLIEPPLQYLDFIENGTKRTVNKRDDDYGIFFLLYWIGNTIMYIFIRFCAACVCVILYKQHKKIKINSSFKFLILLILSFVFYVLFFILGNIKIENLDHTRLFNSFIWFFVFFIILYNKTYKDKFLFPLALLFLITPVCLSFGTNVPFTARQMTYFSFITVLLFLGNMKLKMLYYFFYFIILIRTAIFVFQIKEGFNWHGDKFSEQVIPVSSINIDQNLYLDKIYIDKLKFSQNILNPGDKVLCSMETWGIAALLELKPLSYEFRLPEKEYIREHIFSFWDKFGSFYILLDPGSYHEKSVNNVLENLHYFNHEIYKHPESELTIVKIKR